VDFCRRAAGVIGHGFPTPTGVPPIRFRSDFHCAFALRQCLLGATDAQLADDLGISPSTLYLWQKQHPEFRQAMLDGKRFADGHVAAKASRTGTSYWL
jgi:hypothetical protein